MDKVQQSIKFLNFLNFSFQNKKILKPNIFLLVTFSGGQDSSVLLFLLLLFRKQWTWGCGVICCNHLWQNESFYSMFHIFKLTYLFKLPVSFVISQQTLLNEEQARNWRLTTFQRFSFYYQTQYILKGHTASDQIETTLFQLVRGSGHLVPLSEGIQNLDFQKSVKTNQWKSFFSQSIKIPHVKKIGKKNNFQAMSFLKNGVEPAKLLRRVSVLRLKSNNVKTDPLSRTLLLKKRRFLRENGSADYLFINLPNKNTIHCSYVNKIHLIGKRFHLKFKLFESKQLVQHKVSIVIQPKTIFNKLFEQQLIKNCCTANTRKKKLVSCNGPTAELTALNINDISEKFFIFNLKKNNINKIIIIRPLGLINRFDIQQFCLFWKIPIFPDKSNWSLGFVRNRFRNQILPAFRIFFNPKIDKLLYQLIEVQTKEHYFFNFLIEKYLTDFEIKDVNTSYSICLTNQTSMVLNIQFFKFLPFSLQRRFVHYFLKNFLKLNLNFSHIEILVSSFYKYKKLTITTKKKKISALDEKNSMFFDSSFLFFKTIYKNRAWRYQVFSIPSTPRLSDFTDNKVIVKNYDKKYLKFFIFQKPIYYFFPKNNFFLFL